MSLLPNETEDEIRGLKWQLMTAEARIRDLETLLSEGETLLSEGETLLSEGARRIEDVEAKLRLAKQLLWREGDEGPIGGEALAIPSAREPKTMSTVEQVPHPIRSIDPLQRIRFQAELKSLINKYGLDTEMNTPDDVLANYLVKSFEAFEFTEWERFRRATASTDPTGEPKP